MRIYYRISDNSYPKVKLPGATKKVCLENLKKVLMPMDEDLVIIADNCGPGTIEWLKTMNHPVHETHLGNAGALLFAMQDALKTHANNYKPLYFLEDDYLHEPTRAYWAMQDARYELLNRIYVGGGRNSGYWTLYDHPDKYSSLYNYHEVGKVVRTRHTHWRTSISTTMTFAVHLTTLKQDFPIWEKFLVEATKNGTNHPPDHEIFKALGEAGRELFVAIPGAALHTDLTTYVPPSPRTITAHCTQQVEQWAIELMWDRLLKEVMSYPEGGTIFRDMFGAEEPTRNFPGLARLAAVHELIYNPMFRVDL